MKVVYLVHNVGRIANLLITLHDFQALARSYGFASVPCVLGPDVELGFRGPRKHFLSRYVLLHATVPLVPRLDIWPGTPEEEAVRQIRGAFEKGRSFALGLHDWLPAPLRGGVLPRAHVQRYFHPVSPHWRAGQGVVARARQNKERVVGVHIRHGDFKTHDGGRWFVPLETVIANMRHFEQSVGKAAFVVCSDALFSREDFGGLDVHFGPGHAVADLSALCGCDFLLKPRHSTYAIWASWWAEIPALGFEREPRFGASDFQIMALDPVADSLPLH